LKRLDCERPVLEDLQWVIQKEAVSGPDTFAEEIYEHVLSGRSCMINGAPGSGKSFIIKELAIKLREKQLDVKVIAPTNSAARIIDGETCH
jgi:MoxR-like ATPase